MADAMQGIMSLSPEKGGKNASSQSFLTPEDDQTLGQIRSSIPAAEFSTEILNAAEQADPEGAMELRMMLQGMQLPAEVIEALKMMVEMLLGEPDRYQEYREKFLAEGVPEDLLPPEFDPNFFAALNLALNQMSGTTVQGFAAGGMVMNPIASGIASLGRYGDTMLAHITPEEARMLRRAGGSGTINPMTGLPEFWNPFKAVGNAIKSAAKSVGGLIKGAANAVKKFANSSVGRIVTTVALAYFLGPAAANFLGVSSAAGVAAVSGFVGSAGSTLLGGGSIKDALKAGAVGGLTSGLTAGALGGSQAFQAGSYTGPTTISGQWKQFTQGLGAKAPVDATQVAGGADDVAALKSGQVQGAEVPPSTAISPNPDGTFSVTKFDAAGRPISSTIEGGAVPRGTLLPQGSGYTNTSIGEQALQQADDLAAFRARSLSGPEMQARLTPPSTMTGADLRANIDLAAGSPTRTIAEYQRSFPVDVVDEAGGIANLRPPGYVSNQPRLNAMGDIPPAAKPTYGELLGKGDFTGIAKKAGSDAMGIYDEYLSPSGIQKAGQADAVNAYKQTLAQTGDEVLARAAYEKAMPGMFATYGPLAGVGLGAAYLGGAFTPPEVPKPNIPVSGAELYRRNPYIIRPEIRTVSASTGTPYAFAAGGIADLATGGTSNFPRKTGPINGPGTGTSDSIPAMLSDGEFVFTAKAVRAMGNGSRRKGAKRMYALMKSLEKRA